MERIPDSKRYSIITDDPTQCFLCGARKEDLHEIFGGRNRQLSKIDGLVVPVCRKCHTMLHAGCDKETLNRIGYLQSLGQKVWMDQYGEGSEEERITAFRERYGKSYL